MQTKDIGILLVSNRRLVRAGITRIFQDLQTIAVCAQATNFDDALHLARSQRPQLVLVHLNSATVELLDGVRKFRRQLSNMPVLIISDTTDLIVQNRLLQYGVSGCVSDTCSLDELYRAITAVVSGQRYVGAPLAKTVAERHIQGDDKSPIEGLTHREFQVLLLVVTGKDTPFIARQLSLTKKTVNGYRSRVVDKLQVNTEVELLHIAMQEGLIQLPPGIEAL